MPLTRRGTARIAGGGPEGHAKRAFPGLGRRLPVLLLLSVLLFSRLEELRGQGRDYLSGGELLAVGAASATMALVGAHVADIDPGRGSLWPNPPAWEVRVSQWMGGEPRLGKRNFLDDVPGGALTPAVAVTVVLASDLAYPSDRRGRDVLQDAVLMASGVAATKGVTDLVKGIVARPRPLTHLAPELTRADTAHDAAFHQRSFFSGHAASAFFAATYLDRRMRDIMENEMSQGDYRDWRWVPPVVGYGWATFVGLSRIQAQRHYVTDVAAGALVGVAMGLVFHSLGDGSNASDGPEGSSPPLMLTFSWSF